MAENDLEPVLRDNLLTLGRAFAKDRGVELTSVARLAGMDAAFFDVLAGTTKRRTSKRGSRAPSFTVRVYDKMMWFFVENWPSDLQWPDKVHDKAPAKGGRRPRKRRRASKAPKVAAPSLQSAPQPTESQPLPIIAAG